MNARALLTRIRERLRSRKFELDRLERSYRKQRSEQRVNDHTQDSVKRRDPTIASLARKYNQYCVELARLIEQRKATRNAVPPKAIDMDKLFSLDVDDDIWLDIGLGYDNDNDNDNDNTAPPLWLSNEKIREGIRALLDRDRCEEERGRLLAERDAMQQWFHEEWQVLESVAESAGMFSHVLVFVCSHII
ncbi:hypothetical protein F5050DRAFT_1813708 [Lentinula boryana]|uniref:Uncharacterized protein n=1 Tax=Lentinula boryana TaxID=40481 RepID=A0ABQ8PW40_9AGAR|nr:hypothetical protein F5050DRAFT_1813708 [Lentinula boryana]